MERLRLLSTSLLSSLEHFELLSAVIDHRSPDAVGALTSCLSKAKSLQPPLSSALVGTIVNAEPCTLCMVTFSQQREMWNRGAMVFANVVVRGEVLQRRPDKGGASGRSLAVGCPLVLWLDCLASQVWQ